MSGGAKRLDLQIGSFACSVQGFDDPVEPVQQILRAMQHLLEESPELASAGFNFEPDTIEQLVGEISRRSELDESEVEIVPGLVVIHHGGGAPAEAGAINADPFAADEEATDQEYVNIFAPSGPSDDAEDEDDFVDLVAGTAEDTDALDRDLVADRLGFGGASAGSGPSGGPSAGDIFAEEAGPSDGSIFVDPTSDADGGGASGASGPSAAEGGGADDENAASFFTALPDARGEDDGPKDGEDGDGEDGDLTLHLYPSQADENAEDEDEGGFTAAGLAENAKATSIPDLMASAAAWMVLIKGQTTFSRKEVISVFETIPGKHENSLQTRIKGFGKAVRDGQLVMIEDGVFGLSRKEMERFQRSL
ncbi:MAG: hypothetical protein OEN23_05910 [Paracoccaceae bacterium]|nr:hypothetical protein [Paracoccaceae bacterium]